MPESTEPEFDFEPIEFPGFDMKNLDEDEPDDDAHPEDLTTTLTEQMDMLSVMLGLAECDLILAEVGHITNEWFQEIGDPCYLGALRPNGPQGLINLGLNLGMVRTTSGFHADVAADLGDKAYGLFRSPNREAIQVTVLTDIELEKTMIWTVKRDPKGNVEGTPQSEVFTWEDEDEIALTAAITVMTALLGETEK